jgi:hypothetical protein
MSAYSENASWVVHRGGDVIEKQARSGDDSLNAWERLLYCLYIADYMIRNAGDFANAEDIYPDFQSDAATFAKQLSLPVTFQAFSLPRKKLQRQYYDRFEAICNELRSAEPVAPPNGGPAERSGNSAVSGGAPSVS